jgi:hypothetical protein
MKGRTAPQAPYVDHTRVKTFTRGRNRCPALQILCLGCLALLATAGCTSLGATILRGERVNYNLALQQTNDEQLLLNLVRLKYRDTPIFLEVNSIATQFSFDTSAQAGADLAAHTNDVVHLAGGAAYSTHPTVAYIPLQGEEFAQRFLSPLSLDRLMLLYRSGWPLRRVLLVCVQRLNQVKNAPRAGVPTPRRRVPDYQEFAHILDLISELERQDALDLVYETPPVGDRPMQLVLQIAEAALELPATQDLLGLLRLRSGKRQYPLVYTYQRVEDEGPAHLDELRVETRSFMGILSFLAQAVEVPEADTQAGKVPVTRYETGEPFDWRLVTGDVLRIRSEPSMPPRAAIAVRYRGAWFYLDDADPTAKSTFSLLSQLFVLQAGKPERMIPILTLPIGR